MPKIVEFITIFFILVIRAFDMFLFESVLIGFFRIPKLKSGGIRTNLYELIRTMF